MGFKVLFLTILALLSIQICYGQNSSTSDEQTTDGSTDSYERSPLEKGIEPVFKMCHNFLDLVMPKDFYGESDSSSFNALRLSKMIQDGDYQTLQTDWKDLVSTFGGLGACIIMGLLFFIFMPLVGMIYCCCCCCCHKCGGTKEKMDPKHASTKRWICTILLLICTTFMLAGGIIVFLGSDLLQQSLKNENERGLVGRVDTGLYDFQLFINNSLNSIEDTVTDKVVKDGLNTILPTVENAANRTVDRIKDAINATELLKQAENLGNVAEIIKNNLDQLGPVLLNLKTLQKNVSDVLSNVETNVSDACTSPCPSGVKDSVAGIKFNPDFSSLNELQNQTDEIKNALKINEFVQQAQDSFNSVSDEVNGKVQDQIDDARSQINDINNTVNVQIKSLKGKADPINDGIKNVHDKINGDAKDILEDVGKYTWYGCIGIGCAVLIVVFFYYMGVLYGLCGERPGHRAACCNRETGAGLLTAGICCSFIFAALLMMVVLSLFTLGGITYGLSCKYIADGVENIGDLEVVLNQGLDVNLSSTLGFTSDSNLTVAGLLSDCKADKGIYTALQLDNLFDIDKEFNLTDVLKQIDDMRNQIGSITSTDIELLPDDLKQQLENFKKSSISHVNFTQYTVELDKQTNLMSGTDLTKVIADLRNASATLNAASPSNAQKLSKSADDLQVLQETTLEQIKVDMANLSTTVRSLERDAKHSVPEATDDLMVNLYQSQTKFDAASVTITQEELNNTINDIKTQVTDLVEGAKNAIRNDIGKCRPLYDGIQVAVDAVCVVTLDPLNAIWFGLGWSLFFYIPCFIFAAFLSSLYKRSEKYREKSHDFDDPIRSHDYDNGYRGGRHDDNVPLTRMGNDQRTSPNGAHNYGYQEQVNGGRL
ncbi:hypothetical protein ACF0H5_000053 [Mactra antiquata]